jgi:hypothetical protein
MKRSIILVAGAIALFFGCEMTKSSSAPSKEWESEFLANPCCQTTYELIGHEQAAAVPMILATLDRYAGETNVQTRCLIIQGTFYRPEICTNINFAAIIQRGTNDPSTAVRAKTTHMLGRASRAGVMGDH